MPRFEWCGSVFLSLLAEAKITIKTEKEMKKSEIFASVLADVSAETEIDSDRILSESKLEEVVDARYLVIYLLMKNGFYPRMIAERMRMSQRAVRKAQAGFEARLEGSADLRLSFLRLSATWLNQKGTEREPDRN